MASSIHSDFEKLSVCESDYNAFDKHKSCRSFEELTVPDSDGVFSIENLQSLTNSIRSDDKPADYHIPLHYSTSQARDITRKLLAWITQRENLKTWKADNPRSDQRRVDSMLTDVNKQVKLYNQRLETIRTKTSLGK